jgi:hypothetical protein
MVDVGAFSIVSEITRTGGTGPYLLEGKIARAAKFAQFYAVGDIFEYFCDDGGGLAEYGQGSLLGDGTISRDIIHWTTPFGIGGPPIDWPTVGQRSIRACITGHPGGGTITAINTINGFWEGTVPDGERITRYLFTRPGTLPANLPTSLATCDVSPTASGASYLINAAGGRLVKADNISKLAIRFSSGDGPAVFSLQKNGSQIGTMTFGPGGPGSAPPTGYLVRASGDRLIRPAGGFLVRSFGVSSSPSTSATFSFPSAVSFVAGEKFEVVAPTPMDENLSDIVWTFELS